MLKIALCDDNSFYNKKLKKIIIDICSTHNIDSHIVCFDSGDTLISYIKACKITFNLIFLDILMEGSNGIETATIIKTINNNNNIIFITSSREYAVDSYGVEAISYIIKPYTYEDIHKIFNKCYRQILNHEKNQIVVKNNQDIHTINLDEVVYFESNLRKITAKLCDGEEISFYEKLSDLQGKINSTSFVRCHRSFLTNMLYVKSISGNDIITKKDFHIPISKKYNSDIRQSFINYMKNKLMEGSD